MKKLFLLFIYSIFLFANFLFADDWVTPDGVLVVFNDNWNDDDGNGKSDSRDVAEYYAMRRNVPTQNLLAVTCSTSEKVDYREFYTNILAKIITKILNILFGQLVLIVVIPVL